jgi:four helix bundle protein
VKKESSQKPKMSGYTDLIAWQKAHELTMHVYKMIEKFPQEEKYNFVSQVKRVALAIPTNIVGGFSRWSAKDSIYYYNQADSALVELDYLALLASEFGYITNSELTKLNEKIEECTKLLRSWMKGVRERDAKWKAKQEA